MSAEDPRSSEPRRPSRPGERARRSFLLRLPPEVLEELRSWAASEVRSLNGHIEYLLREALRRRRGGGRRAD